MKKTLLTACIAALSFATTASAAGSTATCASIAQGTVLYAPTSYLHGTVIKKGRNAYGYDYNRSSFEGNFFNSYANAAGLPPLKGNEADYLAANPTAANHWAWPYREVKVEMDWNDQWLSNKDCTGDGLLDRHYGFSSYIGSGAILFETETWPVMVGGKKAKARDELRVEALTSADVIIPSISYFGEQTVRRQDGTELPQLWAEFVVTCYKLRDPSAPASDVLIGTCPHEDNDDEGDGDGHDGAEHSNKSHED